MSKEELTDKILTIVENIYNEGGCVLTCCVKSNIVYTCDTKNKYILTKDVLQSSSVKELELILNQLDND